MKRCHAQRSKLLPFVCSQWRSISPMSQCATTNLLHLFLPPLHSLHLTLNSTCKRHRKYGKQG